MDAASNTNSPSQQIDSACPAILSENDSPSPVALSLPDSLSAALVVASPHSGDHYPPEFIRSSRLDAHTLRRSEDYHVHDLVAAAPRLGAPLVRATFPRAYLDPNREPYELDPAMFDSPLPSHANTKSVRVAAGLGTIPRLVSSGADIYASKLTVAEAEHRIETFYRPYHATLEDLIALTQSHFGHCILLDCHSMPSASTMGKGQQGPDFVLGDCHGTACARAVRDAADTALRALGYAVACNTPYAGGFTTRHYGKPPRGVHALQIEINRRLYVDEATYEPLPRFPAIAAAMDAVMKALIALPHTALN